MKSITVENLLGNHKSYTQVTGDEEALKAVCDVLELDFEDLQGQLEKLNEAQNTADAQSTLEGVMTDEQAPETDTATILE